MIMLKLATLSPVSCDTLTLSASQQAYVPILLFNVSAVKNVAQSVNSITNIK